MYAERRCRAAHTYNPTVSFVGRMTRDLFITAGVLFACWAFTVITRAVTTADVRVHDLVSHLLSKFDIYPRSLEPNDGSPPDRLETLLHAARGVIDFWRRACRIYKSATALNIPDASAAAQKKFADCSLKKWFVGRVFCIGLRAVRQSNRMTVSWKRARTMFPCRFRAMPWTTSLFAVSTITSSYRSCMSDLMQVCVLTGLLSFPLHAQGTRWEWLSRVVAI